MSRRGRGLGYNSPLSGCYKIQMQRNTTLQQNPIDQVIRASNRVKSPFRLLVYHLALCLTINKSNSEKKVLFSKIDLISRCLECPVLYRLWIFAPKLYYFFFSVLFRTCAIFLHFRSLFQVFYLIYYK